MKTKLWTRTMPVGVMAAVLIAIASPAVTQAAAPALQGALTLRPLTPTEQITYAVPSLQLSAGLKTIGVGEPAYLEALVNAAIAPSNIISVTWTLTSRPVGSAAVLQPTPLSTNIPTYKACDLWTTAMTPYDQVAWPGGLDTGDPTNNGRVLLRPDVTGQYTVKLAIVTAGGSGSTNLTQVITAGTYLGVATCALCHSGSIAVEDVYHPWSQTPHSTFFSRAIDGQVSSHYSKNCIYCHTVGYDGAPISTNYYDGGFSDVALTNGWVFPSPLTNGNWAKMQTNYPTLAGLANIQCENCHGPGSQHAYSLGDTNLISRTFISADCSQCHDDTPIHFKSAEWNISLHARASRTPSGAGRQACVRCHTAAGFEDWAEAGGMTNQNAHPTTLNYTPDVSYDPITCQACHDPHNVTYPNQLRLGYDVTLSDGTVVTNAGSGAFCMQCHNNRDGSYTNMLAKYPVGQATWVGGSAFGTHDSPQADILEGVNAETYGQVIASAPHANVISNTCVGCHMQAVASTDPAFLKAGGHTFKMSYSVTNNGVVSEVPMTKVCAPCHGIITDFDMIAPDYAGVGYTLGIQSQVQLLLNKLSTLLPPKIYHSNPNDYVADGQIKYTDSNIASYTNLPTKFLQAYYNWDIVYRDGSLGVHNGPFSVGLLKASIANLTGDANSDGLPDSWQTVYFGAGFATNILAGPNAVPVAGGFPNWLTYALGLNPFSTNNVTLPNGVVWVNGNSVGGTNNTIYIYTAAEVVFDTGVGTNYQIQAISNLGTGWSNIGGVIAGTGTSVSYLTPTRNGAQQFYRVVHTP